MAALAAAGSARAATDEVLTFTANGVSFDATPLGVSANASIQEWGSVGTSIVFPNDDGLTGTEAWVSDGTPEGTHLLKDINTGSASSDPQSFTAMGGKVVFAACAGTRGFQLWMTDGTSAGTVLLKDFASSRCFQPPYGFAEFGSPPRWMFTADDDAHGVEVWVTDLTTRGTQILSDIVPGASSSSPDGFTKLGSNLVFTADTGTLDNGNERRNLWITDGTAGGTRSLSDVWTQELYWSPKNPPFKALGNKLFFPGWDAEHGYELWATDGTTAGTAIVKDIYPGLDEGAHPNMTGIAVICSLVFSARDAEHGTELWSTDGTAAGTALLADLVPGPMGSWPTDMIPLEGGKVVFAAGSWQAEPGTEPFVTDGTSAGTMLLKDINPGFMTYSDGGIFWRSGWGTVGDRVPIASMQYADRVLFVGGTTSGYEHVVYAGDIWMTDGTPDGTVPVVMKTAGFPGATQLFRYGNRFMFIAKQPVEFPSAMWRLWSLAEAPLNQVAPSLVDPTTLAASADASVMRTRPPGTTTPESYTATPGVWSARISDSLDYRYQWYQCATSQPTAPVALPADCSSLAGLTSESYPLTTKTTQPLLLAEITATIPGASSRVSWTATRPVPATPGAVGSLAVTFPTPRSTLVSWVAGTANGARVTRYEYRYARQGTQLGRWTNNQLNTSVTLKLSSGRAYVSQVRAVNGVGAGTIAEANFVVP